MKEKVTYKIIAFDKEHMFLDVEFGDNEGWARISLSDPLPTKMEDIDALVRPYAHPIEKVEAKAQATDKQYNFFDRLVGQERTTDRYSSKIAEAARQESMPSMEVLTELDKAVEEEQRKHIESIVQEYLKKMGCNCNGKSSE